MAHLLYGSPPEVIELDAVTLAHLEVVIVAKFRRQESFSLSLTGPDGGRRMLWMHPGMALQVQLDPAPVEIARGRLEEMVEAANTPGGLRVDLTP